MAYQGYQNGQANGNYNDNFNFADVDFGQLDYLPSNTAPSDVLYANDAVAFNSVRVPISHVRGPGTPIVLDEWIWFRPAAEREKFSKGKIPRVTRFKKKATHVDPEDFYGPAVAPPAAWGPLNLQNGRPIFEYTKYGELYQGRQYDRYQMKMYLYDHRTKVIDREDWVPRTIPITERRTEGKQRVGLTCWLGWSAAQSEHRYPRSPGTQTCRFKCCPFPTIKQGLPRIILDERMNELGLELDPFNNAGYIHLYCLEKNFDLVEIIHDLDFRVDDRNFRKEEANLFSITGRDGKLELIRAYHDWWRRESRRYTEAKSIGRPRDRSNFEETSLSAALLKCKMNHESAARAKTRLSRDGIDITKYWGNLDLYADLKYEHKRNKDRAMLDADEELLSFDPIQTSPMAPPQPRHSIADVVIKSEPLNGYEHSHSIQAMPFNLPPPPVYSAATQQWNGPPLQQLPAVQYPVEQFPQLPMPTRSRKRSLEQAHLQNQNVGDIIVLEPDVTMSNKKPCYNPLDRQARHSIPIDPAIQFDGLAELDALSQLHSESMQVTEQEGEAQIEAFNFEPTDISDDGLADFSFDLAPIIDMGVDQNVDQAEAISEEINSPEVDGKSHDDNNGMEVEQQTPEISSDQEGEEPEPARLENSGEVDRQSVGSDLFDANVITQDELDAIFGKEATPPIADGDDGDGGGDGDDDEEPAREASSEGMEDVVEGPSENEEETEVPEAVEESRPASPMPPSDEPFWAFRVKVGLIDVYR
ncbi:hypothetical protein UCREL1_6885 [Eutypa lata UCREL1]|uniref:Uncharacterized protein n=1 Tax=Eutypa lata (strain UCR-EL1) TaxID=1287681 RepID=M7SNY4_EUTLA|nr:hypothetical protein UCREL1_6885 [Eutypa lata UCREL1]